MLSHVMLGVGDRDWALRPLIGRILFCLFLAAASMGTFLLDLPLVMKWVAFAMSVAFMLTGVVFNYARRFGIRVVWSHCLRGRM
jgi:hypothetical protein